VIVVDDVKVGRLHTVELEEEIKILDITVLPQHRTKGTATSLLNDLLDQARGSGKRVLVYVEIFNPSLGFFEKRGFQKVMDEGIYYLLEWRAGP
jgi:N-acetylglutamate synthase-like GNAT family acetyltransferase